MALRSLGTVLDWTDRYTMLLSFSWKSEKSGQTIVKSTPCKFPRLKLICLKVSIPNQLIAWLQCYRIQWWTIHLFHQLTIWIIFFVLIFYYNKILIQEVSFYSCAPLRYGASVGHFTTVMKQNLTASHASGFGNLWLFLWYIFSNKALVGFAQWFVMSN